MFLIVFASSALVIVNSNRNAMKHNCLIVGGLTIALSRALLIWRILYETHHLFLIFIFPFRGLTPLVYPQKKKFPGISPREQLSFIYLLLLAIHKQHVLFMNHFFIPIRIIFKFLMVGTKVQKNLEP